MVLLLVFMQLTRDLFAIAKFLFATASVSDNTFRVQYKLQYYTILRLSLYMNEYVAPFYPRSAMMSPPLQTTMTV